MKLEIYTRVHDKTGETIWVVKPIVTIPKAEFAELRKALGKFGGRYSRFVNGMVFKTDPTASLINYDVSVINDPRGPKDSEGRPPITSTQAPDQVTASVAQQIAAIKSEYGDVNKQYKASGKDGKDFILQFIGYSDNGLFKYNIIKPADHAGVVLKFTPAAVQVDVQVIGDTNWEEILHSLIPPAQLLVESADLQVNQERLITQIQQAPAIYGTQDTPPGDMVAYMHYFGGEADLYLLEFSPPNDAYVYGSFMGDGGFEGSYWYIDQGIIKDLPDIMNLDYYWKPKQLKEIDDIRNPHYNKPEDPSKAMINSLDTIINGFSGNQYECNRVIETMLDKVGEDYNAFTPEQISFLQRYSGYGGLGDFMDETAEAGQIKGTLYEYYTPDPIVKKMWGLAYKYGFKESGMVLEPSCGPGRFLKYAPVQAMVKAYEINKYSARIANISYPGAQVMTNYFESEFYKGHGGRQINKDYEGSFDLVIGNAPFGKYAGPYAGMGEQKYSGATQVDHHFLVRGLDALKPGGLMVMIVSSRFMGSGHEKIKEVILSKGELIDAYRLPTGIFQNTQVTADILVFRKAGEAAPVAFVPDTGHEKVLGVPRAWAGFYSEALNRLIDLGDMGEYEMDEIDDDIFNFTFNTSMDRKVGEGLLQQFYEAASKNKPLAKVGPLADKPIDVLGKIPEIKPSKTIVQKKSKSNLFDAKFLDMVDNFIQKNRSNPATAFMEVAEHIGIKDKLTDDSFFEFTRFFAESPPPKKLWPSIAGDLSTDMLMGYVHVPELPKKVKWMLKADTNYRKWLNKFVTKGSHQPAMDGILIDGDSDMFVATDGHRLVAIKSIGDLPEGQKILSPQGYAIKEKYPDYEFVFNVECGPGFLIDTQNIVDHLNGLVRINKFFSEPIWAKIIENKDVEAYFNPELLLPVMEMFLAFDEKQLNIKLCSMTGGLSLFMFNKEQTMRAVCMSVQAGDDRAHKTILDLTTK